MNTLKFDGNLTRDPEIKHTPSGQIVAEFALANTWQKKDGGEETIFLECTAWGKRAEEAAIFNKGARIEIEGRLKQDTWEDKNTGAKRSKINCVVNWISVPAWAIKREADKMRGEAPQDKPRPKFDPPETPTDDRNDYGSEDESVPF